MTAYLYKNNGSIRYVGEKNNSDIQGFVFDEIVENKENSIDDYGQFNGEFILKSEIPAPTKEEQSEKRAAAYTVKVDPITAHIQRLRDETEPDAEKIEALIIERMEKVSEIKARYPYPNESNE